MQRSQGKDSRETVWKQIHSQWNTEDYVKPSLSLHSSDMENLMQRLLDAIKTQPHTLAFSCLS